MIVLSINLDKIPEKDIIKGKKGRYVSVVVNANQNGENEYGQTHYAYINQSKEDREAKVDKIYVGNGKEYNFGGNAQQNNDDDGDMPF